MKKVSIEQKVFTTKEAAIIVFIVVTLIALMGSTSFNDFLMKVFVYGGISIVSVFFSSKTFKHLSGRGQKESNKISLIFCPTNNYICIYLE